jgi:hypothetical protein
MRSRSHGRDLQDNRDCVSASMMSGSPSASCHRHGRCGMHLFTLDLASG